MGLAIYAWDPKYALRSPLSQANTLALTEQVAPEQARCRIRACVFSHTSSVRTGRLITRVFITTINKLIQI